MFDAHLHLEQYHQETLQRQVEEWKQAGILGVLAVSTNLSSSYQTLELKARYPDFIYAAIGYHPEQAPPGNKELYELLELIKHERRSIHAIGEVGIPHYNSEVLAPSALERHKELLGIFSAEAKRHQLPILLHAVHDKAQVALDILQYAQVDRAHFHWLKGPKEVVANIVQSGYFISVTPEVCYRERDQILAAQVPVQQLLLETDGPWSYAGEFAGRETNPLFLFEVAKKVAKIKQLTKDDLLTQINHNFLTLLGGER